MTDGLLDTLEDEVVEEGRGARGGGKGWMREVVLLGKAGDVAEDGECDAEKVPDVVEDVESDDG